MATYFSLSTKPDNKGRCEILIRYKSGNYAARAKSGVYSLSDWFEFVRGDNSETPLKGKRIITNEMKEMQTFHENQKTKLSEINTAISDTLKNPELDRSSSDWLLNCIDKYYQRGEYAPKIVQPEITVFQFIDKFINEAPNRKDKKTGRTFAYGIIQQYRTTEKRLAEFAESIGKTDFGFSDIDKSFYDGFVLYLQNQSLTQNTVGKHVKVLKTFMNEAKEQGYKTDFRSKEFYVFTEDTDTIYLNETELQQLKDADFSKIPHLDRVRDWFLLLAWTGSRFSDLEKVTKTDIKDGFITFRQQKTNTKVTIPLHPIVTDILEKYNFNLPEPISNQRFNEYIKEACKRAQINSMETMTRTVGGQLVTEKFEKWEQVSSHTGRRSFCTNMYKRGLSTLMIMSVSGHKTETAFLKYIKVKQHEQAEMMKKEWEKIYY